MGLTDPQAVDIAYHATPIHRVFVSPFYLDAYEVTNRRFIECLDAGACQIEVPPVVPSAVWKREENSTNDQLDRPYWGAGANGAEAFCLWAGGWLPSEAQWERAAAGLGETPAAGGAPRPFPDGSYPPTCKEEWTGDCFPVTERNPKAQRVGLLTPNPDGLFDLGGNAHEWTADLFSMIAYQACPEPCKNPCFGCADKTGGDASLAPDKQPWPWGHVIRGGAADILRPSRPNQLVFYRSQYRDEGSSDADRAYPDSFNQGFRCAYPAKPRH
jgi:formylglycine-generating enzyme required for sulfatase activity